MRPPDALRRRTHLSGRLNSHRLMRQTLSDRTVLSCLAGGVNWALGLVSVVKSVPASGAIHAHLRPALVSIVLSRGPTDRRHSNTVGI